MLGAMGRFVNRGALAVHSACARGAAQPPTAEDPFRGSSAAYGADSRSRCGSGAPQSAATRVLLGLDRHNPKRMNLVFAPHFRLTMNGHRLTEI